MGSGYSSAHLDYTLSPLDRITFRCTTYAVGNKFRFVWTRLYLFILTFYHFHCKVTCLFARYVKWLPSKLLIAVNHPDQLMLGENKWEFSSHFYHNHLADEWHYFNEHIALADPGFPGGGGGVANLLFDQFFPKNCMKMKKFYPRRRRGSQIRQCIEIVILSSCNLEPFEISILLSCDF